MLRAEVDRLQEGDLGVHQPARPEHPPAFLDVAVRVGDVLDHSL
jgi:hypothetical protein